MNEEAFRVDGQPYCIVYQSKRNKSEHHCQSEQHQADISYVIIHSVNQFLSIEHILNIGVLFNHFLYLRDAVGIGIVGMKLDFDGSGKGGIAQEFFRVGSHCLCLFFQCLFFRDIFGLFHERFLIQFLLKFQYIRFFHVVTDKNGETDILTDIYGKIVRRQYEKDNQS